MTGRKNIREALSSQGANAIPIVIPYEAILVRDHWKQLTDEPWWQVHSPQLHLQMRWRRSALERLRQDFLELPLFYTRERQTVLRIEHRQDEPYLVDRRSGEGRLLQREPIGGSLIQSLAGRSGLEAKSREEIDSLVPAPDPPDPRNPPSFAESGKADLASRLVAEYGAERYPIDYLRAPLWACESLWGFEPLMYNIAAAPDLVHYACSRYLDRGRHRIRSAAAMGAAGIWIEECMMDLVSPQAYASLSLPYLRQLIESVHASGMSAVLYFCGNPAGKLSLILDSGCDAVGFEESKKDFRIDIGELAERIDGRCTLLGNLDAVRVLERGSENDLRTEIARQIRAGRRNRNRFISSLGSPVTPATPLERVRLFLDLARELGEGC